MQKLIYHKLLRLLGIENRIKLEFILPIKYKFLYNWFSINLSKKCVLYGSPGSGKKYAISFISNCFNLPVVEIIKKAWVKKAINLKLIALISKCLDYYKKSIIIYQNIENYKNLKITLDQFDYSILRQLKNFEKVKTQNLSQMMIVGLFNCNFYQNIKNNIAGNRISSIYFKKPSIKQFYYIILEFKKNLIINQNLLIKILKDSYAFLSFPKIIKILKKICFIAIKRFHHNYNLLNKKFDLSYLKNYLFYAIFTGSDLQISLHSKDYLKKNNYEIKNIPPKENKLIKKTYQNFNKNNDLYRQSKMLALLLYGPPGCGKTLLANTLSIVFRFSFYYVNSPSLLNKYVGAGEKKLRDLFQYAKNNSPSLIFFDEIDSICVSRNTYSSSTNDKITQQFLIEFDSLSRNNDLIIIGATNCLELIDSALLRSGR
mmetsp:Transcript_30248/g.42165  ORF Transcript_30248/g.42165 Transcript_30248/m.42165 type:complete len:429 (+) Transcript_30248:891-2177(+)